MKKISVSQTILFIVLIVVAIAAIFIPSFATFNDGGKYNSADIAWIAKADEGLRLEASQRDEKYLQSSLLVKNNGVLSEKERGIAEMINF